MVEIKSAAKAGEAIEPGSRQLILEAAARTMAIKGFSGTSISSVCKAAGVKAPTIYWHFSSKENLFAEIVRWKANHFFDLFSSDVGGAVQAEASIDEIAERVARGLQDDPLFLRFLLLLGLERRDMPAEVRDVIAEVRESARAWWQSLLEAQFAARGQTVARVVAEEYAEFGRSLIDGAFFAWDFGDGPDLRKVFRQLMTLVSALNEKMAAEQVAVTRTT